MLRRWILFHIASGHAFFSGVACELAAIALSTIGKKRWSLIARNLLAGLGTILIALSAAPLPPWLYVVLVLALLLWIAAESRRERFVSNRLVRLIRATAALASAACLIVEWPYHLMPDVPPLGRPVLGVVADSVTAGMGEDRGSTWPALLAKRHGITVHDHSVMGATVKSALKQANQITTDEQLVLLEIGGNDLLGGTTPDAFEAGLQELLRQVCRPGRVVIMLELPLPPGYNRFGLIQRRLARRYGVLLVPRRVLLGVLLQDGATVDTIHLSPEGHSRMAEVLWKVLLGAFRGETGQPT